MVVVFTKRELGSRPFSCDARLVLVIRAILNKIIGKRLTTDYTLRSRIPQQGNHFANSGRPRGRFQERGRRFENLYSDKSPRTSNVGRRPPWPGNL